MIFRIFGRKKVPAAQREPRCYPVPEGLLPAVGPLFDEVRVEKSRYAQIKLWKILSDRCPETREGEWGIRFTGLGLEVVEKI